jgi:transcriptional regulator with XRE-family HTH domain
MPFGIVLFSIEMKTKKNISEIIKQRRISIPLTLSELGRNSGVSQSHIARIERGERLPSARALRKIAKPLGFKEEELFMLAGFLSTSSDNRDNLASSNYHALAVDPFVVNMLSHESIEVQRGVIGILNILKTIAHSNKKPNIKKNHIT